MFKNSLKVYCFQGVYIFSKNHSSPHLEILFLQKNAYLGFHFAELAQVNELLSKIFKRLNKCLEMTNF